MADKGKTFSVLHIVLDSGERLPCLVDAATRIPVRVALKTASSIADPVALATDDALAPLVRRFQGRIIDSDEHLPRVEDFNRHTIAGQEARRDRLPTEAVLNGLADIYREHAVEPRDKLRAAALAILVVTGYRIGELLTLPLDCEVRETRGGQPRYGLRYYREKSRSGRRLLAVRWLTPIGAALAQEAIDRIRKITHVAR
jgi:hypothetical protein